VVKKYYIDAISDTIEDFHITKVAGPSSLAADSCKKEKNCMDDIRKYYVFLLVLICGVLSINCVCASLAMLSKCQIRYNKLSRLDEWKAHNGDAEYRWAMYFVASKLEMVRSSGYEVGICGMVGKFIRNPARYVTLPIYVDNIKVEELEIPGRYIIPIKEGQDSYMRVRYAPQRTRMVFSISGLRAAWSIISTQRRVRMSQYKDATYQEQHIDEGIVSVSDCTQRMRSVSLLAEQYLSAVAKGSDVQRQLGSLEFLDRLDLVRTISISGLEVQHPLVRTIDRVPISDRDAIKFTLHKMRDKSFMESYGAYYSYRVTYPAIIIKK